MIFHLPSLAKLSNLFFLKCPLMIPNGGVIPRKYQQNVTA